MTSKFKKNLRFKTWKFPASSLPPVGHIDHQKKCVHCTASARNKKKLRHSSFPLPRQQKKKRSSNAPTRTARRENIIIEIGFEIEANEAERFREKKRPKFR